MNNPPRALLFTDVIDSTQLSHALGDGDAASLWAAHDHAARELLRAHRGREIEKTDGIVALFDRAADAVGFALAYHRALAALTPPLAARAAVHVGPIGLRESGAADVAQGAKRVELDGLVKPVTARVMAIALGGQTLLTADARAALGASTLRVQSHGHWRLKGLPEPVELFEVGDDGAPFTPPPDDAKAWRVVRQRELWLPAREVRHSLPAERDSFVGRDEALQLLARKLEDGARLVSVLGIGGTGKTRLVTRFAWTWLGDYPGGVWFCDLSQARSVDGIHFAVAQGLDVPLGKTEPVVQLAHAIAGRGPCLVILDNFEQVARHAEETLGYWLDRAPQAQFVVTTREVLGIVGEETLALAPLQATEATALFLLRAESVRQGYRPDPHEVSTINQLVHVLDGLPLAIELAAARVRVMPPRALLARMNERFDVLLSRVGRRDRQATLRAAFDWSWELLSETERVALARLSVFRGGFTVDSCAAVLDELRAAPARPSAADLVQFLVDKSFVRDIGNERFDLLESVREYAAEHLETVGRFAGSGPAARIAAERCHGRYFAALDRAAAHGAVEFENLVTACRRAVARGDAETAAKTLVAAWIPLRLRGPFRTGVDLAEKVLAVPGLHGALLAEVETISGGALQLCGVTELALERFGAAEARARAAGRADLESRALLALATLRSQGGQVDAAALAYARALAAARESADLSLECSVLNGLGSFYDAVGRVDDAREHYEAALGVARRAGDRRWEGGTAGNLAGWYANRGYAGEAQPLYLQAIAIARELSDRQWEANARCNLGLLHFGEGRLREAQQELQASLATARELGHARLLSIVQCNGALVAEAMGQFDDARAAHEAAVALARELQDRRSEGQFLGYLGLLHARQGRLSMAFESLAAGEALLREVMDRLSLAILLCGKAEAEALRGAPAAGAVALSEARALAEPVSQVRPESELGRALRHATASLAGQPA